MLWRGILFSDRWLSGRKTGTSTPSGTAAADLDADIPFVQVEEETTKVVKLFRERGMEDKARLLETSDMLYARYSKLEEYIDYFYGCLTPSTGYITIFDIQPHNGGFLLRVPNREHPVDLEPEIQQEKLLNVYREHLKFLKISRLDNVGDLNRAKLEGRMSEVIQGRSLPVETDRRYC